jgi:diacylglycerol kinase family enzyme
LERVEHLVREGFAALPGRVRVELARPGEIDGLARRARGAPGPLWILGGDGTVASVASSLVGTGKPVGILPGGTANVFARELRLPLDLKASLALIPELVPREVDTGEVNGRIFLCCSVVGLLPEVARDREALRGQPLLLYPAVIWSILRALYRFPRLDADLFSKDGRATLLTRSLAVSVNPLRSEPGIPPLRERLDGGRLALYASRHQTRLGMARLVAELALGRWHQDEALDVRQGPTFTVAARHRRHLTVMNDGELHRLDSPLSYRVRPRSLILLAAPHPP